MPIFRRRKYRKLERLYYENSLNNIEKEQATVNDKTNEQKETTETIVQTSVSQREIYTKCKRQQETK